MDMLRMDIAVVSIVTARLLFSLFLMTTKASALCGALPSTPCCECCSGAFLSCTEVFALGWSGTPLWTLLEMHAPEQFCRYLFSLAPYESVRLRNYCTMEAVSYTMFYWLCMLHRIVFPFDLARYSCLPRDELGEWHTTTGHLPGHMWPSLPQLRSCSPLRHGGFIPLCLWQIFVRGCFLFGPCPFRFLLCFSAGWRNAYLAGGSAFRLLSGCFCVCFCFWFAMLYDHRCQCRFYFKLLLHM